MTPEPSGLGLGALSICKSRQKTQEKPLALWTRGFLSQPFSF